MIERVYADGGVILNNPSIIGGMWAFCHIDENNNRVVKSSGVITPGEYDNEEFVTNNLTEYLALVLCLEALPPDWSGHVYSDSRITLGRAFLGWRSTGIPYDLQGRMNAAYKRMGVFSWTVLAGHPTKKDLAQGFKVKSDGTQWVVSEHNVWCDNECKRRAKLFIKSKDKTSHTVFADTKARPVDVLARRSVSRRIELED